MKSIPNVSKYFDLIQVKESVYAAISKVEENISNAGFVDLGDKVVVFDTLLSIEAAIDLQSSIHQLCDAKEIILINSHGHNDHYLGNCIFDEATDIVTSEAALPYIKSSFERIEEEFDTVKAEVITLQKELEKSQNPEEILNIENALKFKKNYAHPKCAVRLPNKTFEKAYSINGSHGSLSLEAFKIAHSPGDVIATSSNKVAFVGDLLFIDNHPYIGAGDPLKLIQVLEDLEKRDIDYFIPGHGPICQKDLVSDQIYYIKIIMALVASHLDDISTLSVNDLPSKYHHYTGPSFQWNIHFLQDYISKQKDTHR